MVGLSLNSSNLSFRSNCGPFLPGCYVSYLDYQDDNKSLDNLKNVLLRQTRPDETAAVIIEPIQGEGGYNILSKKLLQGIRQICTDNNILMIVDEIQTGIGRTGLFLASEHFKIVPDIIVLAKGIASGFPLSLIAANKKIYKNSFVGSMGGTYGCNIISSVAASSTLDIIKEEDLINSSSSLGKYFLNELEILKKQHPEHIIDVRGIGLMLAIELKPKYEGFALNIIHKCIEHNLLLMRAGTKEVIRIIPPTNSK